MVPLEVEMSSTFHLRQKVTSGRMEAMDAGVAEGLGGLYTPDGEQMPERSWQVFWSHFELHQACVM